MDKLRINFSALNADFDTPSFDFYARKQLLLSARLIAIAILSVCLSVTQVDQSKTVQDRITESSPSAAWTTLV